ncbi:nucleotide-sugar transporter [Blyttiomyces helicus]|uniref:Nucleotide-sugar transporter n=1 Tax=Blyttiomyces helicus TaxID=388810 RepID=A0A4P9WM50_9FUNG|nr:nucleotide-sugar transporter [Blyttiomyces helicus]|eukprot:RKO92240.1 nucleotide-sugar transporter [Blyttiomyces helicus]
MYLASAAVLVMELLKLIACVIGLAVQEGSVAAAVRTLRAEIPSRETLQMIVPSGIYAVQNNLLYTALSNLDAATYQVTYQVKILTTALFSVLMLGKHLTKMRWISLVMLLIGVAMVQTQGEAGDKALARTVTAAVAAVAEKAAVAATAPTQSRFVGISAVLTAAVLSGFAGCYFERVLKSYKTSMLVRNVQLGLFGTLFSLLAMLSTDGRAVWEGGLMQGWNGNTWLVVLNQAFGGLLVSVVVKYADSILKGFASSISIVLSSIIAAICLNFVPSAEFIVGATVVIAAGYLYSL